MTALLVLHYCSWSPGMKLYIWIVETHWRKFWFFSFPRLNHFFYFFSQPWRLFKVCGCQVAASSRGCSQDVWGTQTWWVAGVNGKQMCKGHTWTCMPVRLWSFRDGRGLASAALGLHHTKRQMSRVEEAWTYVYLLHTWLLLVMCLAWSLSFILHLSSVIYHVSSMVLRACSICHEWCIRRYLLCCMPCMTCIK